MPEVMAMIVMMERGYQMKTEIAQFIAYIRTERGLSSKTIAAYSHDLANFSLFAAKELGRGHKIEDVDQYVIKAYMGFLADTGHKKANSPVSRGRKLATIKSFFNYLTQEGIVKTNLALQVRMPKSRKKEPSYLTEQEYKRLLRTVKKNATKYFKMRDLAIVTTLLGTGIRLSELVGLNAGDVSFDDGSIKVTRKGKHERILPASDDVLITIKRYLREREEVKAVKPLFISKRNRRISTASVWYLVRKYLVQARIEKEKLSPHTLRHTFATILLRNGENILTIKELLSHRNIRTTEKYLHINNEDLKSAVGKIDLRSK